LTLLCSWRAGFDQRNSQRRSISVCKTPDGNSRFNISTNPTINATSAIVRMLVFRQPPLARTHINRMKKVIRAIDTRADSCRPIHASHFQLSLDRLVHFAFRVPAHQHPPTHMRLMLRRLSPTRKDQTFHHQYRA